MYQRRPPVLCAVGEGDGEAEMTDRKIPSRGQTATFSVNGVKRGDGMLLLYPDDHHGHAVREAEMTDTEETLAESGVPIRSQLARFRVSGTGRGRGIVLLYPDKLAAVNSSAQLWGIFFGPIVLIALSHLLFHDIRELGSAVGVLAGGWIGQGIGKRLAAMRVAANRDGVRLVPLDLITSVQFSGPAGIRGWLTGQVLLVTTADGAEYEFRGMMDGWQAAIAGALTVRGREVHAVRDAITVMPQVMSGEG